jgi:beta-lactamase regulating signal transducer with metallopeptidase domain
MSIVIPIVGASSWFPAAPAQWPAMHSDLSLNIPSFSLHGGLDLFRAFAQAAAPLAIVALWQGALVAAGLAICLRLAPRISAVHRFAVWAAGFSVVVFLPFAPLLAHAIMGAVSTSAAGRMAGPTVSAPHPWLQFDTRWSLAIAALWIVFAALRTGDLVFHSLRLRRLWNSAKPIDGSVAASLQALPGMQGSTTVEICTTRALDRPSVIGFFAPRILIPEWLLGRITREELEHVILHEREHLRRRDDWTNLLQKLCLVFFPLNPALAWIERRLSNEREMACDEGVVRLTHAPRAYAASLASLAERGLEKDLAHDLARRSEALSLGAFERRPELVRRVHSILFDRKILNPIAARAVVGAVACGLVLGSVELARCPQMVAFVPVRPAISLPEAPQAESAQIVPAALGPEANGASVDKDAGVHATNVKAILPPTPHRTLAYGSSSPQSTGAGIRAQQGPELASASPRQQLATAPGPRAGSGQEAPEWVVLTEWRVQGIPQREVMVADYDTGASATPADSASSAAGSNPAGQITVTRMILRVYPATQAQGPRSSAGGSSPRHSFSEAAQAPAGSAAKSASKPASNSFSDQPAAIPFGDGWLVFQL